VRSAIYNGEKVVAKEFRLDELRGVAERRAYESLRFSTILKYIGYCEKKEKSGETFMYLVLDYAKYGDLARLCRRAVSEEHGTDQPIDVGLQQRVKWLYDVAKAVSYMHSKHKMHRDIKPDNVMILEDRTAALGDLEFSIQLESETSVASTDLGTSGYMAPEVQWTGTQYTFSADVYSFGITLISVLVGPIFPTRDLCLLQLEAECANLPEYARHMKRLYEIADKCTLPDPGRRPSARDVELELNALVKDWNQYF
jgi:serine/threonine protein kinase